MNKLYALSFFTLLNFLAYGTQIDVSELVSYNGEVKYYDLGSNSIIDRALMAKTDLRSISVLLNTSQIQFTGSYYKIEPPVMSELPARVEGRTVFNENNEKVNQILAHIRFSTEDINTLSALRVIMYYIVDNPVGYQLISRILNGIGNRMILFKIEGKDFICGFLHPDFYCDITIPEISFRKASDSITAERNDVSFYGYKHVESDLEFSKLYRPFYVGLVHELIHLMHSLEGKKTGDTSNILSHDNFGGEGLWGTDDDLYTIWGVFSVKNKPLDYDYVSELTFRIYDHLPIRMFYEKQTVAAFGEVRTQLDLYAEKECAFEEDAEINPLEKIKNILEALSLKKLITISV